MSEPRATRKAPEPLAEDEDVLFPAGRRKKAAKLVAPAAGIAEDDADGGFACTILPVPELDSAQAPAVSAMPSFASILARLPVKIEPPTDTLLLDSAVSKVGHQDDTLGLLPSATVSATLHRVSLSSFESVTSSAASVSVATSLPAVGTEAAPALLPAPPPAQQLTAILSCARHGDLFEDSDEDETTEADEIEEVSGTTPPAALAVLAERSSVPTPIKPAPGRPVTILPFERASSPQTTAETTTPPSCDDASSMEIETNEALGKGEVFLDFLSALPWMAAPGSGQEAKRVLVQ